MNGGKELNEVSRVIGYCLGRNLRSCVVVFGSTREDTNRVTDGGEAETPITNEGNLQ